MPLVYNPTTGGFMESPDEPSSLKDQMQAKRITAAKNKTAVADATGRGKHYSTEGDVSPVMNVVRPVVEGARSIAKYINDLDETNSVVGPGGMRIPITTEGFKGAGNAALGAVQVAGGVTPMGAAYNAVAPYAEAASGELGKAVAGKTGESVGRAVIPFLAMLKGRGKLKAVPSESLPKKISDWMYDVYSPRFNFNFPTYVKKDMDKFRKEAEEYLGGTWDPKKMEDFVKEYNIKNNPDYIPFDELPESTQKAIERY